MKEKKLPKNVQNAFFVVGNEYHLLRPRPFPTTKNAFWTFWGDFFSSKNHLFCNPNVPEYYVYYKKLMPTFLALARILRIPCKFDTNFFKILTLAAAMFISCFALVSITDGFLQIGISLIVPLVLFILPVYKLRWISDLSDYIDDVFRKIGILKT